MSYIEIKLRSDMCAGNGESSGNSIDRDICMDDTGLPLIPGKRLRGCMRQAAEKLNRLDNSCLSEEAITDLFGDEYGREGSLKVANAYPVGYEEMRSWLKKQKKTGIRFYNSDIISLFCYTRGQTRLEEGVKVDNTLRFTRVLSHYDPLPNSGCDELVFRAKITYEGDSKEEVKEQLNKICAATRNIGSSRNRGLGYVSISYHEEEKDSVVKIDKTVFDPEAGDKKYVLKYKICLDSPLTLAAYNETDTKIPARSVIGCLATQYLKMNQTDNRFRDLFLNGKTQWSALTPVIDDRISSPVPMFLMKLKNDKGRIINSLTVEGTEWKRMKPKTLDGAYVAVSDEGYKVAYPGINTQYHNRVTQRGDKGKMLYMQDSLDAGLIYGGEVIVNSEYVECICELLENASLRFGRSRSAQYAECSLLSGRLEETDPDQLIKTDPEEVIVLVFESDMVMDDGCYISETSKIRERIAEELKIQNRQPEGYEDSVIFKTISGYQSRWNMQKPHICAIGGGSYLCFISGGEDIKRTMYTGEYLQEGFGKCRLYTLKELADIKLPDATGAVDIKTADAEGDTAKRLEAALLEKYALEKIKEYAEIKWKDIRQEVNRSNKQSSDMKQYPIGRLRAMLRDAVSIEDLKKRINDMKESDLSSERLKSRKEVCLDLVNAVYGAEGTGWMKDLGLNENPVAKELISNRWKTVLDNILHHAHYDRGEVRV